MSSEAHGVKRNTPGLFSAARIATLLGAILVTLCSGTIYIYSAYAPQLGARLHITHTQLNIVGLAGNAGAYLSGPLWGRITDSRGPRIPLVAALACFFVGYAGIERMYDDGADDGTSISLLHYTLLVVCGLLTGLGATAGAAAAVNTTAKSFPASAHATTTGLVLSGFGLSAFTFSAIAHTLFPGDTSAFLRLLALGTSLPILVALFVVRTVPFTTGQNQGIGEDEGYDLAYGGEAAALIPDPEFDATDSYVLPGDQPEDGISHIPEPSSASQMRSRSHADGLPDVHGKQLWTNPDFYLIVAITSLLSGTGLMYINNVGSISLALFASSNPEYDGIEAAKWQAAQVSTLSVGNCAGRIVIGLISDYTHTHLCLPRVYCLCIVSFLFVISQAFAIGVSSVDTLWLASALLGLAYGSLWGSLPAIMIEWFGLAHLSENFGYISMSPLVGGNLFSIMFGRDLDAHASGPDPDTSSGIILRAVVAAAKLARRGLPSEHQCLIGRECYISSVRVTLLACMVALVL
ncbi:hypothetical protein ID866_8366, partial [Astraeus odoratus]